MEPHLKTNSCVIQATVQNYWLSLCSNCPPFTLTHARRGVRHCLTAVSIARWSSSQWRHVERDVTR